ncbi:MAG: ring-cleaving dioxygenase, partial [Thermomicrobiaceae bacterium]|nr:ring-cleaving dioxygenase [Thermomicrobiaceae bacterium]
ASQNVAFYTQVLGLRLVKKTVNQDDVSAYHLFYGDVVGHPGTEVTFFDWPDAGPNVYGVGAIGATALRVPPGRLEWWKDRLDAFDIPNEGIAERAGSRMIAFTDLEGQRLELVESDGHIPGGTPWDGSPVPGESFIRGLHSVTLVVDSLAPTAEFLTRVLGFRETARYPFPDNPSRTLIAYEVGPGGPGGTVYVEERPDLPPARVGIGGVHHVAFRTPSREEQQAWRERIASARLGVTPIIDRFYFTSIYFRIPGGILFEIATDGPGFATDEDVEHLGESLALPPFLEPHRAAIERGLRPIVPVQIGPRRA